MIIGNINLFHRGLSKCECDTNTIDSQDHALYNGTKILYQNVILSVYFLFNFLLHDPTLFLLN